ncbi:MAG: hypothetical protein GMKNLPBB_03169 [Myxococcota bacterium]|nr:hypothetical protein [Myxococcota bacterium]
MTGTTTYPGGESGPRYSGEGAAGRRRLRLAVPGLALWIAACSGETPAPPGGGDAAFRDAAAPADGVMQDAASGADSAEPGPIPDTGDVDASSPDGASPAGDSGLSDASGDGGDSGEAGRSACWKEGHSLCWTGLKCLSSSDCPPGESCVSTGAESSPQCARTSSRYAAAVLPVKSVTVEGPGTFELPWYVYGPDSSAMELLAQPSVTLYIENISGQNGEIIHDWRGSDPGPLQLMRTFPPLTIIAGKYPGMPYPAERAMWKVRVRTGDRGKVSVGVRQHFREEANPQAAAKLRLNFILVGLTHFNAGNAAVNTTFQQTLEIVRNAFQTAGIVVEAGEIRDFPEADGFSRIDSFEAADSEARRLFSHPSLQGLEGVNIFWVQEITDPGVRGVTLAGFDGAIPGPLLPGTAHSGVAVTDLGGRIPAAGTGRVIAHELGHYLGLFHTTGQGGDSHDRLADTPQCLPADDANADGRVSVDECRAKDGLQIMFWSMHPDTIPAFTDTQARIMRAHPAVK